MRNLLLLGLALIILTAGCKKMTKTDTKTTGSATATGASSDGPAVHAPTGVVLNPGLGGGGSGGAAQAVRKAAMSAVTRNDMHDLHILIENASGATGQMPSTQEITAHLQQARSPALKKIQEGAIVLTGTRSRENIWAYTKEAQNNGAHFIISSSGIENISAQELTRRLDQQRGS
jgi:hypothetical protein